MHLPSTSAMQTQARVLAFRPRYTTKDVRRRFAACSSSVLAAFVIAVIASSVVNNCTVSTDEAVPEAPSIIDTEAAVRHRYLINHDDVGGLEGKIIVRQSAAGGFERSSRPWATVLSLPVRSSSAPSRGLGVERSSTSLRAALSRFTGTR